MELQNKIAYLEAKVENQKKALRSSDMTITRLHGDLQKAEFTNRQLQLEINRLKLSLNEARSMGFVR